MGVRFPPPAPSKLKAYQLVGFFYVYQKCVFYAIHLTQHNLVILPEYQLSGFTTLQIRNISIADARLG